MNVIAPVTDEIHAIKCDLAAEVLRSSGRLRLRVTGSSMLPSVWPGDTLLIDRVDARDISEGEIVLFRRARRLFVHRVLKTASGGKSTILTRGDAMPHADAPVSAKNLLGRVSFIIRDGKLVEPSRNLTLPQMAVAAAVRRSEIAARVVVGVHDKLQTSLRRNSTNRVVPCQN